jgi:hypothetical protein
VEKHKDVTLHHLRALSLFWSMFYIESSSVGYLLTVVLFTSSLAKFHPVPRPESYTPF